MKETRKFFNTAEGRIRLDISKKACHPLGFYPGDEITNPYGHKAVVIGVNEGIMYYKKENGEIVSWSSSKLEKKQLLEEGFVLIRRAGE